MESIIHIISAVYKFLWGDLITLPLPGGSAAAAQTACAAHSSHKRVVQRCFVHITSCFPQFTAVRWKNRAKSGGQSDDVLVYFFFSSGHGFSLPSCTPRRTQGWW